MHLVNGDFEQQLRAAVLEHVVIYAAFPYET